MCVPVRIPLPDWWVQKYSCMICENAPYEVVHNAPSLSGSVSGYYCKACEPPFTSLPGWERREVKPHKLDKPSSGDDESEKR